MLPHVILQDLEGVYFLFQHWESEDASGVQAGVCSRCQESRKHSQHHCQGQEILVCLNALCLSKLKNRRFVVLTAIQRGTMGSAPPDGLSVPFQHGLWSVTGAVALILLGHRCCGSAAHLVVKFLGFCFMECLEQ